MATNNVNLTINESAKGRTGYFKFNFDDIKNQSLLSSGATGLLGAASQVLLDTVAPGEYIEYVTAYVIEAAGGDTNFTIDVGTGNHSTTAPDNLLDGSGLGAAAINTSLHGLGVADSCNTTNADVGLIMEFESLTTGDLTAGEWIVAWSKAASPLAYKG